nr:PREDICTED: transmembrane protein 247-like [Struthio camelus australis]
MKQPNCRLSKVSQAELEKLRLDRELTMLKCQYEEEQRKRQHKEKMELLQLQTSPTCVSLA